MLKIGVDFIIDKKDYKLVNKYKWFNSRGYVTTIKPTIRLHHLIMGKPKNGMVVDHINGNKLDNRRSNLRFCLQGENVINSKIRKDNKSGYKGVSCYKSTKKWVVKIISKVKQYNLGYFVNKLDAVKKYNIISKKLHGKYARNMI